MYFQDESNGVKISALSPFHILDSIFAPRPTWAILDIWLQIYPWSQPTPQHLSQNHVSNTFGPGPLPLRVLISRLNAIVTCLCICSNFGVSTSVQTLIFSPL